MSSAHADRNLLFGILALQMDFIGRDALVAAMNAWVLDKTKALGQILLNRGDLRPDMHAVLEALVQKHLELHDGDAAKSLAAVNSLGSARQALEQVADSDVQASLAVVSRDRAGDPEATREHVSAGLPTSAGLRFRVLRPHAKGGLGEVYVARDEELHREVALKEIQGKHADDPHSRARFLLEAEVTGGLEHPGVVPVYGLGTYADGRPFYAMRFIKGDSLKDASRRFHAGERPGRDAGERRLAFRELLGRFVDVCNAVAYAHSRGVLHRDLKPGNVMLGRYGETLVVDWGLAKVVGRAEPTGDEPTLRPSSGSGVAETAYGAAVGTPAYMSPEQAAGRLDQLGPASDVYGLGATLYALLTGKTPVEGKDRGEVLRRVQRGEVVPVRQANPRAPAALAAVCQKAMALRPEDRYATPLELAAEVEHWLADEPVSAYRDPPLARLGRWLRRHRGLTAAVAATVFVSLTGLAAAAAVLGAKNRELETANANERAAADLANAAAERERMAADDARQTIEAMTSEDALKFLETQKELRPEQRAFLEQAVTYYGRHAGAAAAAEGQARAGLAYHRMGWLQHRLGLHAEAEVAYRAAIADYERVAAEHPDVPGYCRGLAQSHNNLGFLLAGLGKQAEAAAEHRAALGVRQQLVAEHPAVPVYRSDLAQSHYALGGLLEGLGKRAEAEAEYRAALRERERLAAEHPAAAEYRWLLAEARISLGRQLRDLGKRTDAEAEFRQALRDLERLAVEHPAVPEYRRGLAGAYSNLGGLLRDLGKRSEAEAESRRALQEHERLAVEHPAVPEYRKDLALASQILGQLLSELGQQAQAEAEYRRALRTWGELTREHPAVLDYRRYSALCHFDLGKLLGKLRKGAEAEAEFRQALGEQLRLAAEYPAVPAYRKDLAQSHQCLGLLLADLHRKTEAEAELRRALQERERLAAEYPAVPDYRQDLALSHHNLGALLAGLGKRAEAAAEHRAALGEWKRLAAEHPAVPDYRRGLAASHHNLGALFHDLGKRAETEAEYRAALKEQERLAAEHPAVPDYRQDLALSHHNLGELLNGLGKRAEAEAEYRAALRERQRLAAERPDVPVYAMDLGGSYCNLGHLVRESAARWRRCPGTARPSTR
jgi:eukaryotic-like serine/threonine-protein kinase